METVALLSKLNTNQNIDVEVDEEDLKDIELKKDATYEYIKEFVLNKHGFKVSNLYIAQVNRKLGILERKNYNKSKKAYQVVPICPEDKEKAIIEALEWFGKVK